MRIVSDNTKKAIATMKALGLKRSDYRVRRPYTSRGGWDDVKITLFSKEAQIKVFQNRMRLAASGINIEEYLYAGKTTIILSIKPNPASNKYTYHNLDETVSEHKRIRAELTEKTGE